MNAKRFLFAAIAAFVATFIFDMLWHGFLMKDMYVATESVWRPQSECNMKIMMLSQVLFALAFTFGYTQVLKGLKCKRGIQYGLIIGLILAMPSLGTYCYLPIPLKMSLLWMLAAFLKCVVVGMVVALIYKAKCSNDSAENIT